jgi:PhnB protein
MSTVKPIPDGVSSVIANLTIKNCTKALEWYQRALGAELVMTTPAPDGKSVWHAEMRIGTSTVYANDEMPGMGCDAPSPEKRSSVGFWLWVVDCDAGFKRAVDAGATPAMPPADMFWGDRTGTVLDPFGYTWTFSTHVKDMTMEEMRQAGEAFAKQMGMKP